MERTKKMILLAYRFPFGKVEPFLETEVNYYKEFDQVDIYSLSVKKSDTKRLINKNNPFIKIHPISFASPLVYMLNIPRVLIDLNFYKDVMRLVKQKKFNLKRLKKLIIFVMRARYEASRIINELKKNETKENGIGIIYSYRLSYSAYVGLLIKKKFPNYKVIARAHGSDLYEYSNQENYIPLRKTLLSLIDEIVCISEHGKNYLERKYSKIVNNNIIVSKLGTLDYGEMKIKDKSRILNIVSCSSVVKLKRLEKIIDALSLIDDINIHWTHFGDGILFEKVKLLAQEKLPPSIKVDFRGFVPNQRILEEYQKKDYHIFINVSESEGLPVSIMEATSFGIPVIATDVGGTNEIVKNGYNGFLLDKDFNNNELKELIVQFFKMDFYEYQQYRINARNFWEKNFNADNNYKIFIKHLINLFE